MKIYSVEDVYYDFSEEEYEPELLCATENRFKAYEVANNALDAMSREVKEDPLDSYNDERYDRVIMKVWLNGTIKEMKIIYAGKDGRFDDDLFE